MKKVLLIITLLLFATSASAASFTLNIPNSISGDVVDAFCSLYNYPTTVEVDGEQVANPESKVAFAKRMIREYVKNVYKAYKVQELETQRQGILDTADQAIGGVTVE